MDILKYNKDAWNTRAKTGHIWSKPVDQETIRNARNGIWNIVLTPAKPVPREWFPAELSGKNILCLASGGGQQGPILAAAGANVTVFDNSPRQLEQDIYVAKRDNLNLKTELGNMQDLSRFNDDHFDLIIHPVSNVFVESVLPVWQESARVLKQGGALLAGLCNPIVFIFDQKAWNEGKLEVRHKIPYADTKDLTPDEFKSLIQDRGEPACFGHSLHDLIQGQIEAGFAIVGFYEDSEGDEPLDVYIDSYIATKAVRI